MGRCSAQIIMSAKLLSFFVVDGGFCVWFLTANNCSNPHFSCLLSFTYLTCSSKLAMAEHVSFSYSPTLMGQSVC